MRKHEKFIIWCDKAMAFSFYALVYFLPISIALSEIFTTLALIFYLMKRGVIFYGDMKQRLTQEVKPPLWEMGFEFLKAFKPIHNILNWPITLFLALNIISVILSQHQKVSIEGFLGKSLQSAFLFFTFIECINSKKRLKIFMTSFFISILLICTNGFYQHFLGKGFIHGHLVFDGRISSSFRTHNDFAGYLVAIVPMLFSLSVLAALNNRKKKYSQNVNGSVLASFLVRKFEIATFFLFLASFICFGFTFSRGAWIAFALTLLFMGFSGKKNLPACVLISCLFFGFFYPQLHQQRSVGLLLDPVDTRKEAAIENFIDKKEHDDTVNGRQSFMLIQWKKILVRFTGSGRMRYWEEALNMIRERPVFGVGLNTYSIVGRGYKINWGGYPHNCYLQMAVEIGIVGLLSFLWIVLTIFRKSLKVLNTMRDHFLRFLLLGVLAGYGGFLVHSFFDTNFYSVQLASLMWLLMGLIIAIPKIEVLECSANS